MRSKETELTIVYVFFELIILNLSIVFAELISLHLGHNQNEDRVILFLLANFSWILTNVILSKRNLYLRDGFVNRIFRITYRIAIFIILSVLIEFFILLKVQSRSLFLTYSLIFFIGLLIFYRLLYSYLRRRREKGIHINKVLIVGITDTTRLLKKIIQNNPILGYKFIGFLNHETVDDSDLLGTPNNILPLIEKHQIEMVFLSSKNLSRSETLSNYLSMCENRGIRLRLIPEYDNAMHFRSHGETVGRISLINPQRIPLDYFSARLLKRSFDLIVSTLTIVFILSWLFPVIALLIKLSSRGPVLFIQERTGMNNKTFKCLKFRSMQMNSEANKKQAKTNDPRITIIGRLLRKTNLDEFPQFINVFLGQMSIVGPRPHMLAHTDQYSKLIENYRSRHYVKPGITGWAQVNGFRGETDQLWKMKKRVEYDTHYIESWTIWFDLKIIILTLFDKNVYDNAG